MYTFRLYFSVRGSNRRRSKLISLDASTLGDAWTKALDWSIASTQDDEILNSIQVIEKDMLEKGETPEEYKRRILKDFEEAPIEHN